MDKSKFPRDWRTKILETSFYQDKNTGELVYVEREGDDFFVSTLNCPERKLLIYLDGQCKPYIGVNPVEFFARKEEELSGIARFIQDNVE